MYPPPQHQSHTVARPDAWKHLVPHLHSHHPDAFAYEYIFEDGRLPFLAELHPKNKKDVKTSVTVTIPAQQPKRGKSVHISEQFERKPLYHVTTTISAAPPMEKTSDKLKRAFSLSGMRSSSNNRSFTPPKRQPPQQPASLPRNASLRTLPRSEAPRIPSLVLPTPSPSPEPQSDSSNHSAKSINFSLPRSSWASYEHGDDAESRLDMAFLRDTAHGRLSPGPAPPTELRRDKALALLGISQMPPTPPYTPAGSRAPSVHDYHYQSRLNSRRTSTEQRLSHHSHHSLAREDASRPLSRVLPDVPPSPDLDQTPRAAPAARDRPSTLADAKAAPPPPRMQLKRKTSKFIEHLDEDAAAPPAILLSAPVPVRRPVGSSSRTPSPRLPPSPGLMRSVSLRTPEMRPGAWVGGGSPGVVCTAEARPIVAMGSARLVGS